MDTCCLEDQKKMDSNKVWQWRIMCVKELSVCLEPFHHSNRIGLDFNVASNTHKQMDLQLMTNGVILEVCDFAKTVNKSKGHFITNILVNNFDLGLENEQQMTDFTAQILHKVKDLIKKPPEDKKEVFTLFDPSSKPECKTNNGLNMSSAERKTASCVVEMDDTGHGDEYTCSQAASQEYMKTESLLEDMEGGRGDDSDDKDGFKGSGAKSTEALIEDAFLPKFPFCEEICLNLDVGSKQSLDPGLLTKGVMLELVHFTKILTASFRLIVLAVLEHNFELDLKNPIWFRILNLLKRRNGLITTGSEISVEFKNEPFSFHGTRGSALSNMEDRQNPFQEVTKRRRSGLKSAVLAMREQANKEHRRGKSKDMETNTFSHHTELCTTRTAEGDHCQTGSLSEFDLDPFTGNECDEEQEGVEMENYHICPQGESDLDSGNQNHFQNPKSCSLSSDISRESEASCQNVCAPFINTTNISSSLPIVNANAKSMTCQPEERGLSGGEEPTQTPPPKKNKCDMDQEELGSKKLWKLRANRVKQILSAKEFGPFKKCKKFGLQFNVGFRPKKNFGVDSFLDTILLEIAQFAIAMNSSLHNFIMEILEYNFDFSLKTEYQRTIFTCEMMKRVRKLKDCEDAIKFSKEVFELHGPIPSISLANQSVGSVNAELRSISRMENCDVACGFPPHLQAETEEHISQTCVDLHPFCKEINLKLHVNNTRPNKKLDINKLTYGAMTEVTHFAEKLCGTFDQICVDIVKHNLDLVSQCGYSDLARSIVAQIPLALEKSNVPNATYLAGNKRKISTNAKLDSQNNLNSDAATAGSSQAAFGIQEVGNSPEMELQKDINLKLWQLKENHIQQILSRPHEEHCPFYSYSRCKKIGIDFNVGSGVKQNLDLKLLTNGIMVELHTFATDMMSAQKYFITEILEYNFHLDFHNELYRSAFAQKTIEQVRLNAKKKTSLIKIQFELPDTRCIPEPTFERHLYCPKCYQVRNHKHRQDESGSRHMHHPRPHTMTDAGSTDANCSAQTPAKDPSSTFSAIEEMIMDNYPLCKEIGLCLCVDKDKPKDKLDTHVLTHWIMVELNTFAKRMCETKYKIISDVIHHNFNTGMQGQVVTTKLKFYREMHQKDALLSWLNEVFVIQPLPIDKPRIVGKKKSTAVVHGSEWVDSIKKRKLVLQTKVKTDKLPSVVKKSENKHLSKGRCYPICTEMSLDLEVTSKSGEKETLELKQITKSVCDMEQEEMSTNNYYTCPLGKSDLDSDKFTDLENGGNEDELRIPKCSLSSDTSSEQEELGTENMWKLRVNRVKQILSAKELSPFSFSKKFGLEFNIGFGPKQNFAVDSLCDAILLEIARIAIAMNSSLENFIMEILEYNFDFRLETENHRTIFTYEIMNRVRKLKDCEDAVKFSKEVFELHGPIPSISLAYQSVDSVNAERSSISRMEKCDVACGFPPHLQAETEEHISQKCVDLYPFCKEINLKLHVNNTRPNKKLDIKKLTYGAMTEVTHFAEKLCGTFEQICVDILNHNLDLDLQCGDSDLARSIVARIPAVLEKRKLLSYVKSHNNINSSTNVKLDSQNNPNSDAASAGSSQAAIIDQDVNSSPDIEHQNEFELKLWQLRENHIQQILSMPHEEHCPLYSYSRCKKVGIDFNVGSGVKQNLDPKLLTNGIMVELGTFATALLSAQKYFITEILEYNFHLDFNNELYRRTFAHKTIQQIRLNAKKKKSQMKIQFELPDTRCIPEPTFERHLYCPKCYQVRNHKHRQDESGSRHMHHPRPHTMTDANCSAQTPAKDPSSTFSAIEEMIMDNYPLCKEIGLSLCVDKDKPKDKLDTHVLTHWIMVELNTFAKRMCETKYKIISDVIHHNFNTGMQGQVVTTKLKFYREIHQNDALLSWLNEVFVIQPLPIDKPRIVGKKKSTAVVHGSEWMDSIKKRKLSLQTKVKTDKLPSVVKKSEKKHLSKGCCYPICTEMGLDLEVTSKSGEKETLELKQITKSVCDMEQEKMSPDNYYTCPLGESDLDSDELTDSENSGTEDKLRIPRRSLSSDTSSVPTVNSYLNPWFASQPDEKGLGEEQTQILKNAPTECDMKQEGLGTENMWKLRANRVKQILSAKELSPFSFSKKFGLEFNIGFGPKQNFAVDSLCDAILLEIARIAIAMNSSLENFIMEILEYNFDFSLETEYHRTIFTYEIMNRVRKLKDCEDAVKFSKEVFELHGPIPSISLAYQSVDSVNAEPCSIWGMEKCDVACGFPPHSQAETEEHISQKCVDLYPFCKEINLKLHVNNTRPNKKLDIKKLTYGAMTEVTHFAEKLCGTFEQICVDILNHNLDLDLQCGDSDLARSIVARIPAVLEKRKLLSYVKSHNNINSSTNVKLDSQNNPNSDAASAGSSQAAIIDQDVNSSPDIEHQNEFVLKLWQLRENHIQQILSMPHEEHCPLYSYSRCKKVGIDFNVGSGVKQNLDPKLLTNGIMVELGTFATALLSAQKYFITEILEYNFHLDFNNELYRRTFAHKTIQQIRLNAKKKKSQMKIQFELPDTRCIPEPTFERHLYCPKCYQVRNHKHRQDESGSRHMHHPRPHTMTDANCSAQTPAKDPSSTFSAIEEMIMDNYPLCKEIGLSLCVDKDKPKDKLDTHVLTHWIMVELNTFAKRMCETKYKIISDVIHHNFNTGMQGQVVTTKLKFYREIHQNDALLSWLNEVFVIQPLPIDKPRIVGKKKSTAVVHGSEWMDSIKKRKLSLQTKVKTDKLPSVVKKSEKKHLSKGCCYPICTEMGLDLEVTSKSGEKETLELKQITKSVCDMEQEKMSPDNYYTCPLGESDLDSDELTDSENSGTEDKLRIPRRSLSSDTSSVPTVNSYLNPWFASQPDEKGLGEEQTQILKNAPTECDMKQEGLGTENMWKLRANRVKQILSAKELSPFSFSKKFGLEFNIGFGPKQNFAVDSLCDAILLEIARIAIAMNSSLENFIMEILEYNFDFSLETEYHRTIFTYEIMNRVRKLKDCEDAVKFSKEVFELHGPIPSISLAYQSVDSVNAEPCSIWGMEKCDVACGFPPHSQAETEEHISQKCVDLYPFCKEINLKLHVNNTRPNKKLDIKKLTYGAMTEVTHFAEKLCGTFEQICVDILNHNLDLDLQCGDSDLARSIVARIPAVLEKRKLLSYVKSHNNINSSTNVKLDSQNNPNSDAASAGSSQAAIIDQDVNSSPDIEHQNEFELKLWQLRENHIQQILSMPHEEHCPLYSYSRCKKVGIDFNVGSGVKQNLDPKLLTNGIMVELGTFATALLSAQKYFITEILEYNFHLDFHNELYRRTFAHKTIQQIRLNAKKKKSQMKIQFELPDTRCIPEPTFERHLYCPKCYQVRNHKHRQDESGSGHMHHPRPHTMTDANCSAQTPAKDPSSTFSAIEEMIMDNYPLCKEIGLSLCVDKDKPKDKLDTHVLTHWIMVELNTFAKRMCETKYKIISDVIHHNFNTGMQGQVVTTKLKFYREIHQKDALLSWLNEVFVIQPLPIDKPRIVGKKKSTAVVHGSEWMDSIKKRKLVLQTKVKTDKLPSVVKKSEKKHLSKGCCYPICTEMSLDLEVTSKSGEKETLELKQITKSVCDMEQEKMSPDNYYTCPLGESDLDSDELTDSENSGTEDKLRIPRRSLSSDTSSVPTVNSYLNPWFASQPDEKGLGEEQTQILKNAPTECDMKQEGLGTENMWKLRANRVKQILSAKELSPFSFSKRVGLEFNIGFSPKQNFGVDSLCDTILLEIARFAIAMNSSLHNFIMEILEYNFDFRLKTEYQRNIFTYEMMKRVRKLKDCEDAVKFSKEVFELHGPIPSISLANQSVSSVNAELRSMKCDVARGFPPHSQAETEELISQKCVDLYPFCKEINLKLHVNNTRPNKKLDINKLTYGAMTEVTNFAEKLCGTFEQICVDILNHNLDLDLQCGDSDLARSTVARIPAVLEQRKLLSYVKSHNNINSSTNVKLDSQNNPNSDAASAGSSQAAIIDQDVNSSPDIEHQNEFELKLWQLRENHIQQILSMPHEEHCPLYSYSRCKKVGIDFNVGSGVKQNLDPKLLTNGIMVELGTFATALLSAQKYFITEILEYNFHLDFNNDLYRSAFAQKTIEQICFNAKKKKSQMKPQFELPDTRCIPEPTFERRLYCPKCYQVRNHKHRQDESGSGHMHHPRPHTMTDAGSTDANCSARKPAKDPSSTFSEIEEMIMDNYPLCKEIGLSLCVDKDKPKDKLDTHVLTYSIMVELTNFAKRICGTNYKIISDVIQHNFNTGMQGQVVTTKLQFYRETKEKDVSLSWLNEVFVIQPLPIDKPRIVGIKKSPAVVHGSEWMDSIKKRKLALQTKVKTDKLPSVVKISEKRQNQEICYPICTEMGLDLEVTSKSGERKQKLDLEQLTRAVVFEIYKFVGTKRGCYFPHTVYEILDYNFDISSQHHRSWEFSITTASKFNNMVKSYRKYKNNPEKVFKLPFVFERRASQKISEKAQKRKCTTYPMEVPAKKKNKDHFVQQARYQSDENHVHFLDGAKIYEKTLFRNEDTKLPTDPGTSQVGAGCVGLLQGNLQIKEEEYDPCYRNMNPEPDMEKQYYPLHEVKTESKAEDAEHLVPGEPTERLRFTFLKSENENLQCLLAEPQGCAVSPNTARTVITEWDREGVTYLVPVEAAGCLGSSMVTTGQGNKCTSIKEEQENVPVDSHSSGVHKNEVRI